MVLQDRDESSLDLGGVEPPGQYTLGCPYYIYSFYRWRHFSRKSGTAFSTMQTLPLTRPSPSRPHIVYQLVLTTSSCSRLAAIVLVSG